MKPRATFFALILLLAGCPAGTPKNLGHNLQLSLGDLRSPVCEGTERIERVQTTTAVTRTLADDGRCALQAEWSGPLVDSAALKRQLAGDPLSQATVTFDEIRIIDAVGAPATSVKLPTTGLQVRLLEGGRELTRLGLQDLPRTLSLPDRITRALSDQVNGGSPVTIKVVVELVLDEETRKKMASNAGTLLEIRFTLRVSES